MISADLLKSLLIEPKQIRDEFVATCFSCGKPLHFYINMNSGLYSCKKCGASGNIIIFLKSIGRYDLIEGDPVNRKTIDLSLGLNKDITEEIEEPEEIRMPVGFKQVQYSDDNEISNYLRDERFWCERDFELYEPGFTILRKYKSYALIQVKNYFTTKAFVGRSILTDEELEERDLPKYKNSQDNQSLLLFGLDELTNKTKTAFLTEGIFDKTATTNHLDLHDQQEIKSLATFGKKLSEYQLYKLRNTLLENIIMLYDGRDAVKEIKKIGSQLKKYYNVYCCYTKDKDPNECTKSEFLTVIDNMETIDSFLRNKVQIPKLR